MYRPSKESVGQIGLVLFAIGLVFVFLGALGAWVYFVTLALFVFGLGCGIASRQTTSGGLAIWLNAAPIALIALLFIFPLVAWAIIYVLGGNIFPLK